MQNISESLRKQRDQIMAESGEDLLSRHTSLLEVAVISLYNRLVNKLNLDAEQFRSSAAISALGAFGRGLIGPGQPIPILLLKAEASPWKESWLSEIVSPLSDAGWTVALEQGTMEELLERARTDFSFLLQLLDSRHISGNRLLVEQLEGALEGLLDGRRDELLERIHGSFLERQQRLEDPATWLEPDLEENPGALAEIASIRAACRITSNIRNLEDAIFRGYLNRQEVDFLQQAEKGFGRLASLLGNLPGKTPVTTTTTLHFDEQEILTERLGYASLAGFLPVEAFMQKVFQLFHGVECIAREFWERLYEGRQEGEEDSGPRLLEEGILERQGRILVQTDRYPATAGHMVHLFHLAAKQKLQFANVTRQWILHHRNVLDTASGDPMVREEFLDLIRRDSPDLVVLKKFYDQGFLSSLIPELGAVHGLVQHDAFHLYPVHEHHLRCLRELKKLMAGEYAEAEPELIQIAQGISDPTLLFLAALLHDIGKSSGRGHALRGGEMIPVIARRLGLQPEESDLLQFLVAQHLLLMDSASLRDLADEEMLAHCALTIASPQQLDQLVLLSFADMMSTGPKAQEKWRNTPVLGLYDLIHHLLEKGEPSPRAIAERIERMKVQVGEELADLVGTAELENYFTQLSPRYLLSMAPEAIASHLRLGWQLQAGEEPFVWEVSSRDGAAQLTLMSHEQPGLLTRTSGILTLYDVNITGAQVFTMNNNVVLLIFQCRLPEGSAAAFPWENVKNDMKRSMQGKMALDYRIAAHAATRVEPAAPGRSAPSQILIDNESSAIYTILEVYTADRVGLLYTINRTLYELQIRTYVAKITTKIDQAADVFYIRTHQGEKVKDPEQIEELKNALRFWLDGKTV